MGILVRMMDPMFDIPKTTRRIPTWRLILIMGLTALLFGSMLL
jgi:hypothetical protein